ncbi:hypothetical protein K7I13_09210 [Brucepastera parasyntrophica]|uniref:GNAT family N-acetyltransferase n=1 Tax=Brucepastera parasyntrophica TaxID=2880008 RepID=UPI0021087DED|nr:hypothetical protein [Brucepastera parasyntrophica]ULQ58730.1 hypothetical protein K7I13_09210 [Brucepastera parasyntrophica]
MDRTVTDMDTIIRNDISFLVRQAQPDDIDEIMRIEEICFATGIQEAHNVFLDRLYTFPEGFFVLVPEEYVNESVSDTSRSRKIRFIAKQLAGYFVSEIWDEVPPQTAEFYQLGHSASSRHNPEGTVLYLSSFAVDPVARGTGRFLFNSAFRVMKKKYPQLRKIVFVVNEEWQAARHIYETEGFIYTGRIENFFKKSPGSENAQEKRAALIMEKDI